MLPTEDLFVCGWVVVDDAIGARAIAIPARPGPVPGCSDAELLAIAKHSEPGRLCQAGGLPDRSRTRHELVRTIGTDEDLRLFSGAFDKEIQGGDPQR